MHNIRFRGSVTSFFHFTSDIRAEDFRNSRELIQKCLLLEFDMSQMPDYSRCHFLTRRVCVLAKYQNYSTAYFRNSELFILVRNDSFNIQ